MSSLGGCGLPTTRHDGGPDGGADAEADGAETGPDGDVDICHCVPGSHTERIHLVSDDAELWTYDPATGTFELVTLARCLGGQRPYSMAVDNLGVAWILYADLEDIFTIDVNAPGRCEDPGYVPRREGFGLFGMSFVAATETDACSTLFIHSYSGEGPFAEGPDLGALGWIDPETVEARRLASVDFDGGELAGTGDGRLFAFAGVGPAKLIEYDRDTGEQVDLVALRGLSRTNASAFAFYGGDIYFFTEAPPADCDPCLAATCGEAYAGCLADPACADQLACAIELGDVRDECGGGVGAEMLGCLADCSAECLPSVRARVSRVTHLDYDDSEGGGLVLTVVEEAAPIRVVGAASSPCVPVAPY